MKKELGIFVLLVVLCGAVTARNPQFISTTNLGNLAVLIGMYGIFSIGLGLIIITGGIDLSVGSMCALQGVGLAMMMAEHNVAWPLAFIIIIALGLLLGLGHGLLITRMKLQPFVVTLCGLLIYRGLARFITKDNTKGFGEAESFKTLQKWASGEDNLALGIPVSFCLLMVVAIAAGILLHRSTFGRYLFAVGRNEDAARYSGIDTRKVVTSTYIIGGGLSATAAILFAFYTNTVSPSTHGNFYELYGIAGAVLGGCSLRGGEGSIVGILLGTALIQVLQNAVNILSIDSSLNYVVMGAVILFGVVGDQLFKARGAKSIKA